MTCIIDPKPQRKLSAKLAATLVLSAILALGPFVAAASAQDRREENRRGGEFRGGDGRGGEYRGDRRSDVWGGAYYPAPPVVYGSPYYAYPPPVVYGPALGMEAPGIGAGDR